MGEYHTVGELLDYMEENSQHTPDASECDCWHCNTYANIIHLSERMN